MNPTVGDAPADLSSAARGRLQMALHGVRLIGWARHDSSREPACARNCHHLLMVRRTPGGESLAVGVYAQLRTDILERLLVPGERLKPVELAQRLGVSVNVMREALALLAAQNLIRVERNRGFHVTSLSAEMLTDLRVARRINEGAALRLAVERGGVSWESEIVATHHRMATQPVYRGGDPATRSNDWAGAHAAFHVALLEGGGNQVLLDICGRLSDAAQLYPASPDDTARTRRDVAAGHKALLGAALAHHADRAVALLEAHLN